MPTNSFAAVTTDRNEFSRKWGTVGSTVDPYITGYSFIEFAYLPNNILQAIRVSKNPSLFTEVSQIKKTLHSLMLSVTIPGGTMNKTEFIGLGGVTWSAPTNATYDTNASIRWTELADLPVQSIIHGWFRMIRDYRAGISLLSSTAAGSSYSKANYAGSMYYWTTKPDGLTVQYACCLTGMYPLKDPSDMFGHDIATNDKLEIDVDFSVDWKWEERWVLDRCTQIQQNRKSITFGSAFEGGGTIDQYKNEDTGNF